MDQLQSEFENVQGKLQRLRSRKGRRFQQYLQRIAAVEHRFHNLQEQIRFRNLQNEQEQSLCDDQQSIEEQFLSHFFCSYEENLEFARIFEGIQKLLNFKFCEVCNQICFELVASVCDGCQ